MKYVRCKMFDQQQNEVTCINKTVSKLPRRLTQLGLCCCISLMAATAVGAEGNQASDEGSSPVSIPKLAYAQNQALITNPYGNYFNYKVEGVCYWEQWTPYGPVYSTTLYVSHYLPDLLASVFPELGNNAEPVLNKTIDKGLAKLGEAYYAKMTGQNTGSGSSGDRPQNSMNRFFEVDVVGNPAINEFSSGFQTLPAQTTPYQVYYSSLFDKYFWHNPEAEILLHPQSLIPGVDNEGSMIAPWGSLYPRYGIISQYSQYKAAVMIALRAGNIATTPYQAPTAQMAPMVCGDHCKIYRPITVNDDINARYQRVYPDMNYRFDPDDFGKNDLLDTNVLDPYGQKWTKDGKNRYVFLIWRKYEGCIPGAGHVVAVYKSG